MSDGVPEPPALDPTELAGRKFGKARKGYEQAEVRSALGLAADALRVWHERDERLQARIDQLEAALELYDGTLLLVSHDRRLLEAVRIDRWFDVDRGSVVER